MSAFNGESWRSSVLGDELTLQRGFDITKAQQTSGEYTVISSSGPGSTHQEFKVHGPGVVIGRKGTLGTVFYSERPFWPHDTTLWVKDFHGNDPKFAYYFLRTMDLEQYDCGASNPTINRNHIHILPVRYPPLPIQQRIAGILSAYDDLIENNARRISILEEMARALYREWFVHFRFPGHERVAMVESEVGPNPEGWAVRCLGDVATIVMGQSPSSEFYNQTGEGLPFHQGVTDFGPRFPTDRVYCTVANRTGEPGDTLFSVRAPVGRLNIARTKIVIGRGVAAIRSTTGHRVFLHQQLSEIFQEEDKMGSGSIFKAVTKQDMGGIKVNFPPQILIESFESVTTPVFEQIARLTDKNTNLRRTVGFLLPKLVSGEVTVPEVGIVMGADEEFATPPAK